MTRQLSCPDYEDRNSTNSCVDGKLGKIPVFHTFEYFVYRIKFGQTLRSMREKKRFKHTVCWGRGYKICFSDLDIAYNALPKKLKKKGQKNAASLRAVVKKKKKKTISLFWKLHAMSRFAHK